MSGDPKPREDEPLPTWQGWDGYDPEEDDERDEHDDD
jgi:hypothetical protein